MRSAGDHNVSIGMNCILSLASNIFLFSLSMDLSSGVLGGHSARHGGHAGNLLTDALHRDGGICGVMGYDR